MAFSDFIDRFPKASLPLEFGELSYQAYQNEAQILSDEHVAEWIAPLEPVGIDEYTEVLPVAQFSGKEFFALIYWKAGLLHNHYRLATFDKHGNAIEHRVIAGTYVENDEITTSAATITSDKIIYVVSGQATLGDKLGVAASSSAIRLAIDDSGIINELGKPEDN